MKTVKQPVNAQMTPASGATQAGQPADFEKRILLCVAGLSPQVVTETLYALAKRENPFIPTEIHIITTAEGANRIRLTLLENDPQEQHFYRLCDELSIDSKNILFNDGTIHQLSQKNGSPLDDIRDIDDNETAADAITAIVRTLTADQQTAIHASIAGGRKTMGFFLGYAMSLFGRDQDRLSHVLVSPPFESNPEFYYPPKMPRVLRDRDNRPIHTSNAKITLADIPFVRLRGHLDDSILDKNTSYSDTVSRTQSNVNPPKLVLNCNSKIARCGNRSVPFMPNLFAFYLWLARRLLANNPGIHWSQDDNGEQYLEEYARIIGKNSANYEKTQKILERDGINEDFVAQKTTKINTLMKQALGNGPASPYLITQIGTISGTKYRLRGLALKKEQVEILEKWQPCQTDKRVFLR